MNETRRAVLEALAAGPIAGPELSRVLGVSRSAVWKHVEALRAEGFDIAGGDEGYQLMGIPEYGGLAVEFALEAPFTVEYHETIGSTNDRARELAAEGATDVVVLAGVQTGGRGRLDREWASPEGGIWSSWLVRPDLPPAQVPLLTLAAGVAVARAAREAGVGAGIKWPNDVLVPTDRAETGGGDDAAAGEREDAAPMGRGGEKLSGVLTEMAGEADRVSWVILGVGVNANLDADDLPPGATSLREQLGEDVDRRVFLQRVLEVFDGIREDPAAILEGWRRLALTLGQRVRVETAQGAVVGVARDVTDTGALVVETDAETVTVHAGDCEHLRNAG